MYVSIMIWYFKTADMLAQLRTLVPRIDRDSRQDMATLANTIVFLTVINSLSSTPYARVSSRRHMLRGTNSIGSASKPS